MDESNLIPPEQDDGGKTEMIVVPAKVRGTHQVIIRFKEARLWVAMDPQNAVDIGKSLIDGAVSCGANVTVQLPRREISAATRDRLVVRATNVIRNLQQHHRSTQWIATEVVDTILSAID